MQHVQVGGLRIEFQQWPATQPDQPDLLLLHEGLGCVRMWRDFPAQLALATGCRVSAASRAGYGYSEPYAEARRADYLHREAEQALPALLEVLQLQRPVLIGHSDGASIAILFAAMFPRQLSGLVLMAPHEFLEQQTLTAIRAAGQTWLNSPLPTKLARYHADPQRVFFDWHDTWLSPDFAAWNIEDSLTAIDCPVLAIQGWQDEYASMRQIELIAERVANCRLLQLEQCAHAPHRDQPLQLVQAIGEWLQGLKNTAGS